MSGTQHDNFSSERQHGNCNPQVCVHCTASARAKGDAMTSAPELDYAARLKEIRERVSRATPGPWTWANPGIENGEYRFSPRLVWRPDGFAVAQTCGVSFNQTNANIWPYDKDESDKIACDDAAFIAHSREDVPFLLSVIDDLAKIKARAEERYETFGDMYGGGSIGSVCRYILHGNEGEGDD